MNITVNGEQKELPKNCSVSELLDALELRDAFIAVAINSSCVSRSKFNETPIKDNDKVEILAPMAGG